MTLLLGGAVPESARCITDSACCHITTYSPQFTPTGALVRDTNKYAVPLRRHSPLARLKIPPHPVGHSRSSLRRCRYKPYKPERERFSRYPHDYYRYDTRPAQHESLRTLRRTRPMSTQVADLSLTFSINTGFTPADRRSHRLRPALPSRIRRSLRLECKRLLQ